MTHDELLKKVKTDHEITKYLNHGVINGDITINTARQHWFQSNALLAVVELHKPVMQWSGGYDGEDNPLYAEQCSDCSGNGFTQEYPCPTIRSIEKELA